MKNRFWIGGWFLAAGLLVASFAWNGAAVFRNLYAGGENRIAAETVSAAKVQSGGEQENLSLHALSAVLMDGDSGRVLYGKEAEVFRPMASTTKIMTCILALENGNLSDICTVSEQAASQPKVHLGAGAGTRFRLEDLLYSLMLESHNDAAVIIAEQVGGSVEGFAAMMNQKARDIGCKNTFFVTPNGLDAEVTGTDGKTYTHGTTAADLARIMRYCVQESPMREQFLAITRTGNYSFTDADGKATYSCVNHNAFLSMMEGALTGKTGFTGGAGYSYVAALKNDGRTYVLALLGSGWPPHKTYKWADAKKLFAYGEEYFHYRDVFAEPSLPRITVRDGIPEEGKEEVSVGLTLNLKEEDRHLRLLLADSENVTQKVETTEVLDAPVLAGDVVGTVTCSLNGETVAVYPVYADKTVKRRDFAYCARRIWELFVLPGVPGCDIL